MRTCQEFEAANAISRGAFLLGESGTCFTSLFQKAKSRFVALKNGMFQNYVSGNQKHVPTK
jgi:hypothetical protein